MTKCKHYEFGFFIRRDKVNTHIVIPLMSVCKVELFNELFFKNLYFYLYGTHLQLEIFILYW